jgi:hypothetical protein
MAHLRHAVLSDARPLCTQEQTSAADLEARALALDAIEKRLVSLARCRPGADDQALQAAGNTTLRRPGCWPEWEGHHNSGRWQLGPDAGAAAPRSDLRCGQVTR